MIGATAALGLSFWIPIRNEERAHTERLTKGLARSVQTDITDEMRDQLLALAPLANLLSFDNAPSQKDWEAQAGLFINNQPGYVAIQWVDATYHMRWEVIDGSGGVQQGMLQESTRLRSMLAEMMHHRERGAQFTPAFRLGNGNIGRRILMPIGGDKDLGFVVATIDEQRTIAHILTDHTGRDYMIAVLEDNDEVYKIPGTSFEQEKEWAQEADVLMPGATWRVRVWPEPKMLREIGSNLSELTLLMGSVIGLLLFLTTDFARTSYLRLKEIGRARDELEWRVEQRTMELQLSNQALEIEIGERKEAEESLQELSRRLLQLRDAEQRRIARELHDSTVQIMGALAIELEKAQLLVAGDDSLEVRKSLADSSELVERATAELRTISFLLHPPILDELGLHVAVSWYAGGFSSRSGIRVDVDVREDLGRLPHELELTLFRIVQEALTNVHRHSASPTVEITVRRDADQVTLQIVDHGHGMPPGTAELVSSGRAIVGVGIAGMRERARQLGGSLEIESSANGTLIRATLPLVTVGSTAHHDTQEDDTEATTPFPNKERSEQF